uniref:Uncharacterized protein n=1 Tax=Opuntia streptacantha TaxID=393608 RepID=A0A7C9EBQ4_OPUST
MALFTMSMHGKAQYHDTPCLNVLVRAQLAEHRSCPFNASTSSIHINKGSSQNNINFQTTLVNVSMSPLAMLQGTQSPARRKNTRHGKFIRPNIIFLHFPKQNKRFLVMSPLNIPINHTAPRDHIPLRHCTKHSPCTIKQTHLNISVNN